MKTTALYIATFIAVITLMVLYATRQQTIAEVVPELPANFTIKERFPTMGDHVYDITDDRQAYGTVEQVLSLGKKFVYLDKSRARVATAHARVISWGAQIDVFDANGKSLGTIKEQMFTSLLGVTNKYSVLDSAGNQIAESDKFQLLATKFTVKDNTGSVVATLSRPAFNIGGHTWSVSINNKTTVDSRVLIMIGAFKTAEDNSK